MAKYKLTLAYDGSSYGGWQAQPNATSIQQLLEQSLSVFFRTPMSVAGAGRTDAGVHALGQTAHFTQEQPFSLFKLQHALNALLPKDIRINSVQTVPEDFHARYSATGKIYHYHLHLSRTLNPFTYRYSWQIPQPISIELLMEACRHFLGTRDFTSFANEAHKGAAAKNGIRSLRRLDVVPQEQGVRLEFEADGFLYKMVRNITGTLVDVCLGHYNLEELPEILHAKNRRMAGQTAPPQGLFLMEVLYNV